MVWHHPQSCGDTPIGAQSDYHLGNRWVDGAKRLLQIKAEAIDPTTPAGTIQHSRRIDLTNDETLTEVCTSAATFAPFRQLKSIQERAFGADVVLQPLVILPPVTFEYGTANIVRNSTPTIINSSGPSITALAAGGRRRCQPRYGLRSTRC